jgi:hypothetical protein
MVHRVERHPDSNPLQKGKENMPRLDFKFQSPYIFGNRKTGFSVEIPFFGKETLPCPLMKFVKLKDLPSTSKAEGSPDKLVLASPKCKGCYAVTNLNVYTALKNKILQLPKPNASLLEKFREDMILLKAFGIKRLRFFSFSDFTPDALPFILIAAKVGIEVHILSKMLTVSVNEKSLLTLFNQKKVVVSLSFNTDWLSNFERIKSLVELHKPKNVQFNFTLNPKIDKINLDWVKANFQVLHLKNKEKRRVADMYGIPETQTCAVFGEDGSRVEAHGSCKSCNNCNLSYIAFKKGKIAKLPALLVA